MVGQFARLVVGALARDLADFAETARVDQRGDPRAGVHFAATVLARDLFSAAHLLGQFAAAAQFLEFGFPAHAARCGTRAGIRKDLSALAGYNSRAAGP